MTAQQADDMVELAAPVATPEYLSRLAAQRAVRGLWARTRSDEAVVQTDAEQALAAELIYRRQGIQRPVFIDGAWWAGPVGAEDRGGSAFAGTGLVEGGRS